MEGFYNNSTNNSNNMHAAFNNGFNDGSIRNSSSPNNMMQVVNSSADNTGNSFVQVAADGSEAAVTGNVHLPLNESPDRQQVLQLQRLPQQFPGVVGMPVQTPGSQHQHQFFQQSPMVAVGAGPGGTPVQQLAVANNPNGPAPANAQGFPLSSPGASPQGAAASVMPLQNQQSEINVLPGFPQNQLMLHMQQQQQNLQQEEQQNQQHQQDHVEPNHLQQEQQNQHPQQQDHEQHQPRRLSRVGQKTLKKIAIHQKQNLKLNRTQHLHQQQQQQKLQQQQQQQQQQQHQQYQQQQQYHQQHHTQQHAAQQHHIQQQQPEHEQTKQGRPRAGQKQLKALAEMNKQKHQQQRRQSETVTTMRAKNLTPMTRDIHTPAAKTTPTSRPNQGGKFSAPHAGKSDPPCVFKHPLTGTVSPHKDVTNNRHQRGSKKNSKTKKAKRRSSPSSSISNGGRCNGESSDKATNADEAIKKSSKGETERDDNQKQSSANKGTKRKLPTITIKDDAPDRIVNPLLQLPRLSDYHSGSSLNGGSGRGPVQAAELWNILQLYYPRPDTFPISYYARLFGWCVPVPLSRTTSQHTGTLPQSLDQTTLTSPASSNDKNISNRLPRTIRTSTELLQLKPVTPFDSIYNITSLGSWYPHCFERQRASRGVATTSFNKEDLVLDHMDPVYQSLFALNYKKGSEPTPTSGVEETQAIGREAAALSIDTQKNSNNIIFVNVPTKHLTNLLGRAKSTIIDPVTTMASKHNIINTDDWSFEYFPRYNRSINTSIIPSQDGKNGIGNTVNGSSVNSSANSSASWFWNDPKQHQRVTQAITCGVISKYKSKPSTFLQYQFMYYKLPEEICPRGTQVSELVVMIKQDNNAVLNTEKHEAAITASLEKEKKPIAPTTRGSTDVGIDREKSDEQNPASSQTDHNNDSTAISENLLLLMYLLVFEHARACDVLYCLVQAPYHMAPLLRRYFRMTLLPLQRHTDSATNDSSAQFLCDLKQFSYKYTLLSKKMCVTSLEQLSKKDKAEGNSLAEAASPAAVISEGKDRNYNASTAVAIKDRYWVRLPNEGETMFSLGMTETADTSPTTVSKSENDKTQSIGGNTAFTRTKRNVGSTNSRRNKNSNYFCGAVDAKMKSVEVGIRAKLVEKEGEIDKNIEIFRINFDGQELNKVDNVPAFSKDLKIEILKSFSLNPINTTTTLTTAKASAAAISLPPVAAIKKSSGIDNNSDGDDDLLEELIRKQKELRTLENDLEGTSRRLLQLVVDERTKYEECAKQREESNKVLLENEKILARRKEMDLAWQEQLEQDMDAVCDICGDGEVLPENQILFCEACNVAVHQICYGIEKVPKGDYYCKACKFFNREKMSQATVRQMKRNASNHESSSNGSPAKLVVSPLPIFCELCPRKQGAFIRTDTAKPRCRKVGSGKNSDDDEMVAANSKWVHVVCAKWQGLNFVDKQHPYLIEDVTQLKKEFRILGYKCCLCLSERGSFNKCRFEGCNQAMHVTCARASGLCDVVHGENAQGSISENAWTLMCPEHSVEILKAREEEEEAEIEIDDDGNPIIPRREKKVPIEQLIRAAQEFPKEKPLPKEKSFLKERNIAKERNVAKGRPAAKQKSATKEKPGPKEKPVVKQKFVTKEKPGPKEKQIPKEKQAQKVQPSKSSKPPKSWPLTPFKKMRGKDRRLALANPSYEAKFIEEILKRLFGVRCEVCDAEESDGQNLTKCSTCGVVFCDSCHLKGDNVDKENRAKYKCKTCLWVEQFEELRPPPKPKVGSGSRDKDADNTDSPEMEKSPLPIIYPKCYVCHQKGGWLRQGFANPMSRKSRTKLHNSLFNKIIWCHALCAQWNTPSVGLENNTGKVNLSNVVLGNGREFVRPKVACFLCGNKVGLKMKCIEEGCNKGYKCNAPNFHVTCARQCGLDVGDDSSLEEVFYVKCYHHGGNAFNLRARLEDLIEFEKRRAGKNLQNDHNAYGISHGCRLLNAAILAMRILGWAWRWAEWWVDYGSNWEPFLEPGEREEDMTKEQLKIVDSTRQSRCKDARLCRLAAFGAALRNRMYDIDADNHKFDNESFERALRAVLNTRSLVGPLSEKEIRFFVEWLGRAYRSRSRLLGFGDDKIEIAPVIGCVHVEDKSPKYELVSRKLPGKQKLPIGEVFEKNVKEIDDFETDPNLITGLSSTDTGKRESPMDAYEKEQSAFAVAATTGRRKRGHPGSAGADDDELTQTINSIDFSLTPGRKRSVSNPCPSGADKLIKKKNGDLDSQNKPIEQCSTSHMMKPPAKKRRGPKPKHKKTIAASDALSSNQDTHDEEQTAQATVSTADQKILESEVSKPVQKKRKGRKPKSQQIAAESIPDKHIISTEGTTRMKSLISTNNISPGRGSRGAIVKSSTKSIEQPPPKRGPGRPKRVPVSYTEFPNFVEDEDLDVVEKVQSARKTRASKGSSITVETDEVAGSIDTVVQGKHKNIETDSSTGVGRGRKKRKMLGMSALQSHRNSERETGIDYAEYEGSTIHNNLDSKPKRSRGPGRKKNNSNAKMTLNQQPPISAPETTS